METTNNANNAPKGKFQKGPDARRHTFTSEECRRGYAAAYASLLRRFPTCDPHFLMCAIIGSKPWHTLPQVQYLLERDEPLRDTDLVAHFMQA